ncbi:DUF3140 domain-containing protein [Sphingomonas xinjiangensis]|uniref:Uncharacterized protein n=1 Tax=Sphingomonas xinjiangensis TaxID=643568 RepID=A0A840YG04_9SPHN|nr:DUF3140 domain-containing protein [Sphingomonas xinjiangensis]MBB5709708.1 hypothetical protein [Sphingomonas xinjiangensis]
MSDDPEQSYRDFPQVVNLAPAERERWLGTQESRSVGITHDGGSESVGHHTPASTARRFCAQRKRDADYAHMAKVVGYVHRHLAQGPEHKADIPDTR